MSDEFDAARARTKRPCPIWIDAFLRDTQELEADEIGGYFLILAAMWSRPSCDFPDDERKLARVCRVSTRLWKSRVGPAILAFLTLRDGAWISPRLLKEAAYTERQVTLQHSRRKGEKSDKPLENNEPVETAVNPRFDRGSDLPNYPITQPVEAKASTPPAPQGGDVAEAYDAFKAHAQSAGWPVPKLLSQDRKRQLLARLRDLGGLSEWNAALEKAQASDLICRGSWFSLNWVLKPANLQKLIEGNYDNRDHAPKGDANAPRKTDRLRSVITAAAAGTSREDWPQSAGHSEPILDGGRTGRREGDGAGELDGPSPKPDRGGNQGSLAVLPVGPREPDGERRVAATGPGPAGADSFGQAPEAYAGLRQYAARW